MSKFFASLVVVFLVLAGPATSVRALEAGQAQNLPVDATPLVAETSGGEKRFTIEIAVRPDEQSRGLMFRETMPDDRGMLFVFNATRPAGFWMENTPMPLDLLFIGEDARVQAVLEGVPFSRATISPGVPSRFVLELRKGAAQRHGIKVGDRLRHPVIDAIAGAK